MEYVLSPPSPGNQKRGHGLLQGPLTNPSTSETTVASAPPRSGHTGCVSTPRLWVGVQQPRSLVDLDIRSPRANTERHRASAAFMVGVRSFGGQKRDQTPNLRTPASASSWGQPHRRLVPPLFPCVLPLPQLLPPPGLSLSLVAFPSRTGALAMEHMAQDEAAAVQPVCLARPASHAAPGECGLHVGHQAVQGTPREDGETA